MWERGVGRRGLDREDREEGPTRGVDVKAWGKVEEGSEAEDGGGHKTREEEVRQKEEDEEEQEGDENSACNLL